ncbi:glutathione-disulfide reductase [Aulographum hederae CBS 113979]|uniref:Glutathione-disulfide reductase n=1 Tax=Aulographum hederae CBS 113979 TaxID=1176131 RepID=A0A6G1H6F5_9PEZI|nr:glutathione-disulfide reductase [Aulographum hederae CBS 113979]
MAPTESTPEVQVYDYIVIGGGSGGSGAARRAAGWYKAKTLLVENGRSGGCCVNVGCIPKKMTWLHASINELLPHARAYGYAIPEDIPFDFKSFKEKRDATIVRLNQAYERNWAREGIELVRGTASFVPTASKSSELHELVIALEDGSGVKKVAAKHVCVATGGAPMLPSEDETPGAGLGITSDGFFEIDVLPKNIAIVGAGYIAVELAGVLNALGVKVHMFIRGETLLRRFDEMIQTTITRRYEDVGVVVHKGFEGFEKVERVEGEGKMLKLVGKGGKEVEVEELLWAIGRKPETEDLKLENVGVEKDGKGYIRVDEFQNSSVEGIYALGDVTGQMELTPVAIAAGRHLSNRLFGPPHLSHSKLSYKNIPTAIFSHPEIGTIGLTTSAALTLFPPSSVKTYQTRFSPMFFDILSDEAKSENPIEYKLVCVGEEERVVGLHLVGTGSSEVLQGFAVAVGMGARKRDFDATVAIHPTAAEEIVTMK